MKIINTLLAINDEGFTFGSLIILILIIIFFSSLVYLHVKRTKLFKSIAIENVMTDKELSPIWQAYQKTFVSHEKIKKTNHNGAEYFSEYSVLNIKIKVIYLKDLKVMKKIQQKLLNFLQLNMDL